MIRQPYSTPPMPSGISSVIAASGPYAALVKPSNPEDRDSCSYADVLGSLFTGGQRPSKQLICD